MSANSIKSRNTKLENAELYGNKKTLHKKWKNIARELSDRNISLGDIADLDSPKQGGLMQVAYNENMTMGELVLLRQYSEAICNGSTKAAEFVRDTMGEKPSTQIDMSVEEGGLSQMSLKELEELRDLLKKNGEK